jgi:hypothetical protein
LSAGSFLPATADASSSLKGRKTAGPGGRRGLDVSSAEALGEAMADEVAASVEVLELSEMR